MPRRARLDAPGTLHHAIVRGIERRKIVDDVVDRKSFVERLGIAKLILLEGHSNNVNPDDYGLNHNYMQYWNGKSNWIVENRDSLFDQRLIVKRLRETYKGSDSKITGNDMPLIRKGYYGEARWSSLMMLRYIEMKIIENPAEFDISLKEFETQEKLFYENQAFVATMPLLEPK